MKAKIVMSLLLILFIAPIYAQTGEWRLDKSKDGVSFYIRYRTVDGTKFCDMKAVNKTGTKKQIYIGEISFYSEYNTLINEPKTGGAFTLKPNEAKFGEPDGLWWIVPGNYPSCSVRYYPEIKDVN